jgi:parallel beta-helix repeat protein
MRSFNILKAFIILIVIVFTTGTITIAQQSNNNAFLFDGESSKLYVNDGAAPNGDAIQEGFKFFNISPSYNQITVQAWVYMLGDTPSNIEIPIVYRTVNNGKTFSMYLKDNRAYFSVGNNNTATVNTEQLPAFQWLAITGTYDGSIQNGTNNLKIYSGGTLASATFLNIAGGYDVTNEVTGLFVGKSSTGAFKGLIDEIRIFDIALGDNNISNSGGNGNPAEPFPSSLDQYLRGQWSFTEIQDGLLHDLSTYYNHLHVNGIDNTQIYPSKHLPFFVVTSTLDDGDADLGDGKATSYNGEVTLRSAIEEANAFAGSQIIYFYIPGSGPHTITPGTALDYITEQVYLDGTGQSGYTGSPLVKTNGANGGLTITGGGSTVQGLSINNSSGYGLTLSVVGGNTIEANQISGILISSSGNNINDNTIANLNGYGIFLNAANDNTLSVNTISGNANHGVVIQDASYNVLNGNNINSNNTQDPTTAADGIHITTTIGTSTGNEIGGDSE